MASSAGGDGTSRKAAGTRFAPGPTAAPAIPASGPAGPAPPPVPFGLRARQGEPFWTDDTVTTVKAAPRQTGGSVALLEQLLVAGRERPARVDLAGDEIVYVLEGIIDVTVGSDRYTLEAGGVLFVPQGAAVAVTVLSATARTLVVMAPADEAMLRGIVTA